VKAAAQGGNENVDNRDDPDIRQLYNRDHHEYPYKSHGQYLRACYALMGCSLFIAFNGWRTFVSPMSVSDFLACYIAVRPFLHLHIPRLPDILQLPSGMAWCDSLLTLIQILFFITIYVLYQIKFNGWNPLKWQRRASKELQVPKPQVATSVPRRGHIALKNTDTLFTVENVRQLGRWLWVWLK
jgi:yeast amino acid transporter